MADVASMGVLKLAQVALGTIACAFLIACKPKEAPSVTANLPAPQAYPANVHIVVDTSASMAGFFKGDTELKNNLNQIAATLTNPDMHAVTTFYLMGKDGAPEPTDYNQKTFSEAMRTGALMRKQESLLQNTFTNILNSHAPSLVSIFVSDSIMSYSTADVRANPSTNRDNLSGLRSRFQEIFNGRPPDQDVLLLAATSKFDGTYFDYQNVRHVCCKSKRPYYIWLIGKQSEIRAVANELEKEEPENVKVEHELSFTNPSSVMPSAVLPDPRHEGKFYPVSAHPQAVEIKQSRDGQPITFAVALNLSGLPADMQTVDFLRNHLRVASNTAFVKAIDIKARIQSQTDQNNDASKLLPSYTHILTLSVGSEVSPGETIEIALQAGMPSWVEDWSNTDDRQTADAVQPTTFGLQSLCEGIANAYRTSKPVTKTIIEVRN